MAAILPYLPAIISGASSIIGGIANRASKTSRQGKQDEIVNQLIQSLHGEGPFSHLFTADEATFQKSFVEPAKARFKNQIAPQIQQAYISTGQHRGTGLDDTLTRAGVDMDQLLNQHYMDFQQGAQNRQVNAMNSILGMGAGVDDQSIGSAAGQGFSGYATGEGFGKDLENIINSFKEKGTNQNSLMDTFIPKREGFENEPYVYNPYTGIQE